ncbi:chemotaxis protein [Frateuria aurantia]
MRATTSSRTEPFTQLAGYNRLALLTFKLGEGVRFGINILKTREVLRLPQLERMPGMHPLVAGGCDYRGEEIAVIDLAKAMAYPALAGDPSAHLMVTEFNRGRQGFIIGQPDRIIHCRGTELTQPSGILTYNGRVNALTHVDDHLIAIIDVEQILASIEPATEEIPYSIPAPAPGGASTVKPCVLVVDDSAVARRQITRLLDQLNLDYVTANDGALALSLLQERVLQSMPEHGPAGFDLVISDIEMPQMDGYTLSRRIRESQVLRGLPILLHSSISGVFNDQLAASAGADRFLAKFAPGELSQTIQEMLAARTGSRGMAAA